MRRGTGARACEILASMASSRLRPWEGKRIRRECSTFCAHDLEAEHCAAPPWRWASSPGITNFSSAWRSATLEELTLNPASLRFHLHLSAVIRKPGLCGLARLGQRLRSCVSHTLLSRHRGLWERSFRGLPAAFRVLPKASAEGHPSLLHLCGRFADSFKGALRDGTLHWRLLPKPSCSPPALALDCVPPQVRVASQWGLLG